MVDIDDVDALEQEIIRVCTGHPYTQEDCLRRAKVFDKDERMREYIALYRSMERAES